MSGSDNEHPPKRQTVDIKGSHFSRLALLIGFMQWLDTWKKVGILLSLSLFVGGGYFIYVNSELIIKWWLYTGEESILNIKNIDSEVKSIIRDTHADAIMVWELDRRENLRVLRYFMIDGQRIGELEGASDIMLRARVEPSNILIDLLNDSAGCFYLVTESQVGRFLVKSGINYYCAVTIPPDHSFMRGFLVLGFRSPPASQDYIKQRLRIASDKIVR